MLCNSATGPPSTPCCSSPVWCWQPWRFVRVRSSTLRQALADHVDAQNAQAAQQYACQARQELYRSLKLHGLREAPELIVVFCDEQPKAGHGLGIVSMPEMLRYSCVLAIHTLWLAARLRGIGVGWVSILEPGVIRALLSLATGWEMVGKPPHKMDWSSLHLFEVAPDGAVGVSRLNISLENNKK